LISEEYDTPVKVPHGVVQCRSLDVLDFGVQLRTTYNERLVQMYPYEHGKSVKNTEVGEVFDIVGKRMLFLYDYGDEWHFILQLKRVVTYDDNTEYPALVESVGEAPLQYELLEGDF